MKHKDKKLTIKEDKKSYRWYRTFNCYVDGYKIGTVDLDNWPGKHNYHYTHSSLMRKYQGKGYGKRFYYLVIKEALKRGYKVSGNHPYHISEEAKLLWKSKWLHERIEIVIRKGYPRVIKLKNV